MDKRAQVGHTVVKVLLWFLFLIIVLLSVTFLVKSQIQRTIDTKAVEADFFSQELILTNNGISYTDEFTGRFYPGIIDLSKFNLETVTKSMSYGPQNYFMSANFTLKKDDLTVKSVIYNEEWYIKWKPLAKTYWPGTGGAKIVPKTIYVLIKDGDKIYPCILLVEEIYPNK